MKHRNSSYEIVRNDDLTDCFPGAEVVIADDLFV